MKIWRLMHASPGNLWRAPMDTADDAELETTYKPLNAADRCLLPHSSAIHSQSRKHDSLQYRQRRLAL